MADEDQPSEELVGEVPDGAAVFPLIPADLGIQPLLLAFIHATVFLAGSSTQVVDPAAADEAVQSLGAYVRRLKGAELVRTQEDMECLVRYARQQKWSKQLVRALQTLLADFGAEDEE